MFVEDVVKDQAAGPEGATLGRMYLIPVPVFGRNQATRRKGARRTALGPVPVRGLAKTTRTEKPRRPARGAGAELEPPTQRRPYGLWFVGFSEMP